MTKSLPTTPRQDPEHSVTVSAAQAGTELTRAKWLLWHGNTFRALQVLDDLCFDLEHQPTDRPDPDTALPVVKKLVEFRGYINANAAHIPNYGERHRCGEPISSSIAESTVNQVISRRMVKKQQMRWSPTGAHLLLQVRTRVLNHDLVADFARWYPGFTAPSTDHDAELVAQAA
jgi:hypothetical protein